MIMTYNFNDRRVASRTTGSLLAALIVLLFFLPGCRDKTPDVIIPFDDEIRQGTLDNGLTYFIRNNNWPENSLHFAIVQKVGSMQEEQEQRGLAHFLEHMAFNGSDNFPGRKTMIDYLENYGVKFGENINAYTSYDETVYYLSGVPSGNDKLFDSCLLILHDWSGFLTLDDEQIEKERPIIVEEWRTRNNASTRVEEKTIRFLFEGTRYADRMPIGTMEIIQNFTGDQLRDYYRKWYRPDLQGIIVVGDLDVDQTERRIREIFSEIPVPVEPSPRVYYEAPQRKELGAMVITDPELTGTSVEITANWPIRRKEETKRGATLKDFLRSIQSIIITDAFNSRLGDMTQEPGNPFSGAGAEMGPFSVSRTSRCWSIAGAVRQDAVEETIATLVRENERLIKYGLSYEEVERAKMNLMSSVEHEYLNREMIHNSTFADKCTEYFLSIDGAYTPDIEYVYQTLRDIYHSITAEEINKQIKDMPLARNRTVIIRGPESGCDTYPSEKRIGEIVKNTLAGKISPPEQEQVDPEIMPTPSQRGRIISEEPVEELDAQAWTLSNGMRVYVKNTEFEPGTLRLSAFSQGGTRLYSDQEITDDGVLVETLLAGGLGEYPRRQIPKALAGKMVETGVNLGPYDQQVFGMSSYTDMETMFKMIHLHFTAPRYDPEVFEIIREQWIENIHRQGSLPDKLAADTIRRYLFGEDNPRIRPLTVEQVTDLDYGDLFKAAFRPYSRPQDFTVIIVGSIYDEQNLRDLVRTYLATIPPSEIEHGDLYDARSRITAGRHSKAIYRKSESPLATVQNFYSGILAPTPKNDLAFSCLINILEMEYTETLRESEGGTYGASTSGGINRDENGYTTLTVSFDTGASAAQELSRKADVVIRRIAVAGPDADKLEKVRNYYLKNYRNAVKSNPYWMSALTQYSKTGENPDKFFIDDVNSLTAGDIRHLAATLLGQGNHFEIIVYPL